MAPCSPLVFVVAGIVAVHYAVVLFVVDQDSDGFHISKRAVALLEGFDGTHDRVFDTCILAEPPAWTADMAKIFNRSYDPLATCDRSFVPVTVLGADGRVRWNRKYQGPALDCSARAIEHGAERRTKFGEWHKIDEDFVFATDVIEVECNGTDDDPYTWLHHQIWTGPKPRNPDGERPSLGAGEIAAAKEEKAFRKSGKRNLRPSVHIIFFDSIASTQARRSFPRTVAYIEKQFEAIHFRHVNRVGENSFPNGVAVLFNKMVTYIDRHIFGGSLIEPDFEHSDYCHRCHDNDSFILQQYEEVGYKTMMAEDWANGVFNWPGCCGFVKQPTTHYMRPFQNRYEQSSSHARKQMSSKHCLEPHMYLLDYLEEFMRAYPDTPLASLIWASCLGHDWATPVFHADRHLHDFFKRNHDQFDNSFIFLMGDHGLRLGRNAYRFEVNNPMLWIAPPRALRSNIDLMRNMRRNAGQLVTHFDTYSTLFDIVKHAPASNFTEWMRTYQEPGARGGSLLRPLPSGERNCRTLPIPPKYCLCEINRTVITDQFIREEAGIVAIDTLNELIETEGLAKDCVFVRLKRVQFMASIGETAGLHELLFDVEPSGGSYTTFLRLKENGEFEGNTRSFTRTNAYGRTADCISDNELRPFCFCRNMTTTSKVTTKVTTTKVATTGASKTASPSPSSSPRPVPSKTTDVPTGRPKPTGAPEKVNETTNAQAPSSSPAPPLLSGSSTSKAAVLGPNLLSSPNLTPSSSESPHKVVSSSTAQTKNV